MGVGEELRQRDWEQGTSHNSALQCFTPRAASCTEAQISPWEEEGGSSVLIDFPKAGLLRAWVPDAV